MLLERGGDLVTREELRAALWPTDTFVDFDHGLHAAVSRLREVLGDSADEPRLVETLPRRGYRFIGPIVCAKQETEENLVDGERRLGLEKQLTAPASHWDGKKIALVSIVLLLILGPSVYLIRDRAGFPAKVPDRKIILAVLPFENLGGDPDQEYFSDGLTEETIVRLGNLNSQRLAVIARSSSMHYKHSGLGVTQIGRELGADYLLEGTVHRDGGIVRVTAELVQVRDQTHLWSRSYQSDVRDVGTLQGDLAQGVASEIQLKLTPEQQARLGSSRTTNPEAHEAYLKGLYFWNKITE
jgi:TolB-like protein